MEQILKTYTLKDGREVVCDFTPQVADNYRLEMMRLQLLALNFLPEAVRLFTLSGKTFFDQQRIASEIMLWQYMDDRRRMREAGLDYVDNDYLGLKHEIYTNFQSMTQEEIEAQCNTAGSQQQRSKLREELSTAQQVVKTLSLTQIHDPRARLAVFVRELEVPVDLDDLISRIQACGKPAEVAALVVKPLVERHGLLASIATQRAFILALVPFVTYPSKDPYYGLKNALRDTLLVRSHAQKKKK